MISIDAVIAANLRGYRAARQLTQEEVAQVAEMSLSTYRDTEAGVRSARGNELEALAAALGVTVSGLLSQDFPSPAGALVKERVH